jgi:4-azaleucine resistance transporter AzlC
MPSSRRAEFFAGVRAQLPLLLGVAPFGMAYGAFALDSGLSGGVAQAMSSIVFAGASQFIAAELFAGGVPGVMIVLAALLVNARHLLYSASLAPHVEAIDRRWRWLLAYLLTDEAYATTLVRYSAVDASPYKHWFFFGSGLALWATWQVTTALGIVLGASVPDSWSLDFTLPLTFIALLVPALRGRPALAAAAAAGLAAVLAFELPYATGLLVATAAGLAAGLAVERGLGSPTVEVPP